MLRKIYRKVDRYAVNKREEVKKGGAPGLYTERAVLYASGQGGHCSPSQATHPPPLGILFFLVFFLFL
jgi:hypothetical protein